MSLQRVDGEDRPGAAGVDAGPLESIRRALAGMERYLWVAAVLGLLGDLLLTWYGLEQGLTEANPVARAAVARHGYLALVVLKSGALLVGVLGWLVLPRRYRAVVPLTLAAPWTVAVAVNLLMLTLVP